MKQTADSYFFSGDRRELCPIAFGERICERDFIRPFEFNYDFYLLHYIAEGKAIFRKNGKEYAVHQGQVFLTKPSEIIAFESDGGAPMHYIWIRFKGESAKRLDALPAVMNVDSTPFLRMVSYDREQDTVQDCVTGELFLVLADLTRSAARQTDYISIIRSYIYAHPTGCVSVGELQRLVNLNRQYMSAMFKRRMGLTPQQYIRSVRIEKARALLCRGVSATECAALCGYGSIYAFSKAFKKCTGVSPCHYAQQMHRK